MSKMNRRTRIILENAMKNRYSDDSSSSSEAPEDPYHNSSDSMEDPTYVLSENENEASISGTNSSIDRSIEQIQASPSPSHKKIFCHPEKIFRALVKKFQSMVPNTTAKNVTVGAEQNIQEWHDPVGNHQKFTFNPNNTGINPNIAAALVHESPSAFFSLYLDDEVLQIMTDQTNNFATQKLMSSTDVSESSRLHAWTPTTKEEMKKFIGILGYMGLVKLPSMERYWSKRKQIYQNSVVGQIMSRNRFELLLNHWHFSDNELCPEGDRGYKIVPLMNIFIKKFQESFTPSEEFCIDESLVPFRGRLIMKQYIPLKTHKYGVKVFKLCSSNGFTWNMKLYCGKHSDGGASVPTNIVMELSRDLLNSGRTVVTDNYYTSLELANKLLDNKTHLLGTLRANRRGNPKEVSTKKLKTGEIAAKENNRGICVLKWKDKRDVLMLSTKHTHATAVVQRRTGNVEKPQAVLDYNKAKSSIDLSDQMSSYNSCLRKTLKWYRKIAIELVFGTAMVNAHYLYKTIRGSSMSITDFKENVVEGLMFPENDKSNVPSTSKNSRKGIVHLLQKKEGLITKNKVPKVTTYCTGCEENPHFCFTCFAAIHK